MARFVQFEYNDKPFPTIDESTSDGILSLETALEPALSLVDQLDDHIKRAKQLCHLSSDHDLTEDQSAAVYLYTDNYSGQSLPEVLNQALQSGDQAVIEPWLGFLKLFKSALNKLPTVKKRIWRGLPMDIFEKLKENEELVCWSITSCSMSSNIIKHFLTDNSVFCSIESLDGKDVRGYTQHDSDEEVLLLPGTRFRVKSKGSNNGMDRSVIYLEEISDINDEPHTSTDITMTSSHESANEEDTDDNDHQKTTSTNIMNKESLPSDENLKKDTIEAVITFASGDHYKLTYEFGKKQGYGIYFSVNNDTFQDQAADDKATGEGICAFQNGDYFIGTFEHGARHGQGILCKKDGSIEVSAWTHDEPTDQSLQILSSGNRYEWTDRNNSKRWYGTYYDDHGNRYIGNVNDGQAHGLGIRFWSDGSRYEGNFENDKKHGYGRYYYTDRSVYVGQWENDEINGNGELQWCSGTKYEGQFINGKRNGQGKLVVNGRIQEGKWENDEYVDSM